MTKYRPWKTADTLSVLKWRDMTAFEKSNWERRIREKCTHELNPIYQPLKEYQRRIKKCEREIAVYDAELEERGEPIGDITMLMEEYQRG